MTTHQSHWRNCPAMLLGRRPDSLPSRCRWATSSATAGASSAMSVLCRSPSTRTAASTSYWEMPFRKGAQITVESLAPEEITLYYQIDYALTDVDDDAAYFHAQWRRSNPLPYGQVHTHPGRHRGQRPLCRHVYGVGREQLGLVGRGRNQVLHGRRQRVSHYLRHRHGRLLRRRVELRRSGSGLIPLFTTPFLGLNQVLSPTACTAASSASACTAGTSWTLFASGQICA